jgi:hypothetical protein
MLLTRFIALGMLGCSVMSSSGLASSPGIPPRVLVDLEHNARALNPLAARLTSGTVAVGSPEEALRLMGIDGWATPENIFIASTQQLNIQDGKFRERRVRADDDTREGNRTYDGRFIYGGTPGVGISRERPATERPTTFGFDYLPAIGMQSHAGTPPYLRLELASSILEKVHGGATLLRVESIASAGGELTLVSLLMANEIRQRAWEREPDEVRTAYRGPDVGGYKDHLANLVLRQRELPEHVQIDYYLDPQRRHAVVQIDERFSDGSLVRRTRNSEFQLLEERDLWLPRHSRVDHFWFYRNPEHVWQEPIFSTITTVEGPFGLERVPDDMFVLTFVEAGMDIADYTFPRPFFFTVAAGREDLARAFLTLRDHDLPADLLAALSSSLDETSDDARVVSGTSSAVPDPRVAGLTEEEGRGGRFRSGILLLFALVVGIGIALVLFRRRA